MTNPVPDGYSTVTPHLVVDGAADAIEFYQQAFDAVELGRMPAGSGKLMHAELQIGSSRVLLTDPFPHTGKEGPRSLGGTTVSMHLYVDDADAVFEKAVTAGAKVLSPMEDAFWGDRYGRVEDPWGHVWAIATHREDLTPEQIMERAPTMGM